jgi:tetratricopeptide (TPR) repeat protein
LKDEKTKKDGLRKQREWKGYPPEAISFRYLESLPAPPLYADFLRIIREGGIVRGEEIYREILNRDPNATVISEQNINDLSYELVSDGKVDEAIRILQLNIERFPRSATPYDYLAHAFKRKGNQPCVVYSYRKLLEVLPQDTSLIESAKTSLKRNATENLNKLKGVPNNCEIKNK